MRYPISFNPASKAILGALGTGPARSWVEIRPDEVYGQMGWAGSIRIPRDSIVSAERVDRLPGWLGFGVHGFFGTWAFNGSNSDGVKLSLRKPAKTRVLFLPVRPLTVYFSLEQPDDFLRELSGSAG